MEVLRVKTRQHNNICYTVARRYCRGGEMVDALALGASEATHGGSSPLPGTKKTPKGVSTAVSRR